MLTSRWSNWWNNQQQQRQQRRAPSKPRPAAAVAAAAAHGAAADDDDFSAAAAAAQQRTRVAAAVLQCVATGPAPHSQQHPAYGTRRWTRRHRLGRHQHQQLLPPQPPHWWGARGAVAHVPAELQPPPPPPAWAALGGGGSGRGREALRALLAPGRVRLPDVAGAGRARCQLAREPLVQRFLPHTGLSEWVARVFVALVLGRAALSAQLGAPAPQLSRFDLFHGHVFLRQRLGRRSWPGDEEAGLLLHSAEYPRRHSARFPHDLGFCQRGSTCAARPRAMDVRNAVLAGGRLAVLDVGARGPLHAPLLHRGTAPLRTVYESDLGAPLGDVLLLLPVEDEDGGGCGGGAGGAGGGGDLALSGGRRRPRGRRRRLRPPSTAELAEEQLRRLRDDAAFVAALAERVFVSC